MTSSDLRIVAFVRRSDAPPPDVVPFSEAGRGWQSSGSCNREKFTFKKKKKHPIILPINNITDQIKFIYKNVLREWKYRRQSELTADTLRLAYLVKGERKQCVFYTSRGQQ